MTAPTSATSPDAAHKEALAAVHQLLSPRGGQDPFPLYRTLRTIAPVLRCPLPVSRHGLVLSRYAECSAALRHPALVPVRTHDLGETAPNGSRYSTASSIYESVVFQDGARHTRIRQLLNRYFGGTDTDDLRRLVDSTALRFVDDLAARAAKGAVVDLVEALTLPFPLAVISALFGIDFNAARRLAWSGRILPGIVAPLQTAAQRARIEGAAQQWAEFFADALRSRRGERHDDLLSALTARGGDGGPLDEREALGNLLFVFTAGYDSSTSLLGTATRTLLAHPRQAAMVRHNPAVAPGAVQESLRYDPPVHVTLRIARETARVADIDIPAGTAVLILLASANRDPELVSDPDRFDVTRVPGPNLAFSAGPHFCVGARLARMEGETLLPLLLRRFPRMRLAGVPRYRSPGTVLRGIDFLPVHLVG